ncbi:MAG: radical SAM protein [Candidatus Riflebacteria bacterium]|nr:radical SAM protein [Candidatus Riflebacteria bacterium]
MTSQPAPAATAASPRTYYSTTSICPHCGTLLPGKVVGLDDGVFVVRDCPTHGHLEGLACSDRAWFDRLPAFDVAPSPPTGPRRPVAHGCPADCGLCAAHRQRAGTAAVEISNECDQACPTCLADNRSTFRLTPAEVAKIADDLLASQGAVDAFTLSGGEPTIHPQLFEILEVLDRPAIARIVINSNGRRIATDDAFLDRLARHPKVYVSLHYDGPAAPRLRGVEFARQQLALDRLIRWNIKMVPLLLAARDVNEADLGPVTLDLLTRSPAVKSVMLSMMAYCGSRGSQVPIDPRRRLTIPDALAAMESGTGGVLRRADFIPLPMPNPLCAAIGYFLVQDREVVGLLPLADQDRVIEHVANAHFVDPGPELEALLRLGIDTVYADPGRFRDPERVRSSFKALLAELFPAGRRLEAAERRVIAENRIKTVYLMQFMDAWTFDSVRMSKCSCQHFLPDGKVVPSCGYYTFHRGKDPRFADR